MWIVNFNAIELCLHKEKALCSFDVSVFYARELKSENRKAYCGFRLTHNIAIQRAYMRLPQLPQQYYQKAICLLS
ncbi:hypothetical protein ACOJR9_03875 [Alteromonas sp. A081]|uniref:hypothetical protein n=1 Tax=Alteromonas sp. A081 TaxID=3410269 RepID=UPI003B98412E